MKTYYTIYKITNKINGKIYIGAHKTNNLEDEYMGSGTHLNNAIKKYGIENFEKEIIHFLDTEKEMYEKEEEIVTKEFIKENTNYNLKLGGPGNYFYINKLGLNNKVNQHLIVHELRKDPEYDKTYRAKMSKSMLKRFENEPGTFNGKTHSDETKNKMKETHKKNGHAQGEKNSQFGTCWIYSLEEKKSIKINTDELDNWVSKGWIKGRKLKF
jgi:group I intron endonuclease